MEKMFYCPHAGTEGECESEPALTREQAEAKLTDEKLSNALDTGRDAERRWGRRPVDGTPNPRLAIQRRALLDTLYGPDTGAEPTSPRTHE